MNTTTKARREELAAKIEPLREQIQSWREKRAPNEHMPEALWEAATALAKEYGVSPVQRILRVDYRGLEYRTLGIRKERSERAPVSPPTFVELPNPLPSRRIEHTIELEDGSGRRMSVRVSGGNPAELSSLVQAFWRP